MSFKIYTKTGDLGETSLFGGRRLSKSHLRIECYGTVDELNAFIGLLRDGLSDAARKEQLKAIQDRLFVIGSNLASDPEKDLPVPDILASDIDLLEKAMDTMDEDLPPLKNFILPGGHPLVSQAHVCRTVCRRAERLIVALQRAEPVAPIILQYLNRLSDYFFILSRHLALQMGVEEIVWNPRS
ncbi:MAG: cob(I)yrinic acid a,c-diamide adenosyltransferase [Bacteroidota bacterium]